MLENFKLSFQKHIFYTLIRFLISISLIVLTLYTCLGIKSQYSLVFTGRLIDPLTKQNNYMNL